MYSRPSTLDCFQQKLLSYIPDFKILQQPKNSALGLVAVACIDIIIIVQIGYQVGLDLQLLLEDRAHDKLRGHDVALGIAVPRKIRAQVHVRRAGNDDVGVGRLDMRLGHSRAASSLRFHLAARILDHLDDLFACREHVRRDVEVFPRKQGIPSGSTEDSVQIKLQVLVHRYVLDAVRLGRYKLASLGALHDPAGLEDIVDMAAGLNQLAGATFACHYQMSGVSRTVHDDATQNSVYD